MKTKTSVDSFMAKARAEDERFLELIKSNYSLLDASRAHHSGDRATLERNLLITWDSLQGVKPRILAERFGISAERIRDICDRQVRWARQAYKKNGCSIPQKTTQFICRCGVELCLDNASPTLLRENGWLILVSNQGGVYYVCSGCAGKIQKAAKLIAKYSDRFVDIAPIIEP